MPIHVLDVYLYDKFVGKLTQEKGNLSFSYSVLYLEKEGAIKLSASLPLSPETFSHHIVEPFFSGLLPDEIVRKRLARYLGVSERNTFGLLKEIGGECAGAISVYSEGIQPESSEQLAYKILEDKEADDVLSHLDKRPMLAGEEDIRISGAGAQDKLMISLVEGKIAIPLRNTPSTHILKPAIRYLDYSVHNEFFCMTLAKRLGLLTPSVDVYYLCGVPYYLVERYDRRLVHDGKITRLHQEDFCQALHIPPEQKYENEGGPTLSQCFSLLDQRIKSGCMAGSQKIALLRGVIFNFLIGNGDAHGKNFSLLYDGHSESFSPLYDLMCTLVYSNFHKGKMAMKIGGKYKFTDVSMRHFEELAKTIGFRPDYVKKQVRDMADKIAQLAPKIQLDLNQNPQTACALYQEIVGVIKRNTKLIES